MYSKNSRVNQFIFVMLFLPILALSGLCGYTIYHSAKERVELKKDFAEVNNIQYGLLSVDAWKDNVMSLVNEQINEFRLNHQQEESLQETLDEILNKLITQANDMMMEKQKTFKGKIQKFAFKTFVDVDKVRERVPEFSKTIIDQIKNPKNKRKLKNLASAKLEELTDKTHSITPVEKTTYALILEKYNVTKLEDLNVMMKNRTEDLQAKIFLNVFEVLGCLSMFILTWFLIRKSKLFYKPLFIMSTVMALIVLFIGLTVPMIEIDARIKEVNFILMNKNIVFHDQVIFFQSKSIMDVAHILITAGKADSMLVGILVLVFSILFPVTKLLSTEAYLLGNEKWKNNKIIQFFAFKSGKWSMADVMVVAIFMAYVGFKGILDAQMPVLNVHTEALQSITTNKTSLQPGFILFIAFVFFSLILSEILKFITKRYPGAPKSI